MSVLRKVSREIDKDFKDLGVFVDDMFETMQKADGIGLAAPQIGKSLRIFVIDATPLADEDNSVADFKKEFINPKITRYYGEEIAYNEGCLSIPNIREDVRRPSKIDIEYFDREFNHYSETYEGLKARIIQHEFDHLQGTLFTDKISPIRKKLIKGKLTAIEKGKFKANYKVMAMAHA